MPRGVPGTAQDRRPYWRDYYAANKHRKARAYTEIQREANRAANRRYRERHVVEIKVARALSVTMPEARLLIEVANRRTNTCASRSAAAPASNESSTTGTRT